MSSPEKPADAVGGSDAPMPPVTTQRVATTPPNGNGNLAPPFKGAPRSGLEEAPAETTSPEVVAPWGDIPIEGTVQPAFEADVSETEAAFAALSQLQPTEQEFPLDAFIIPAHTRHVPTGLEGQVTSAAPAHTPVTELAERLEKLSHRLRVEDPDAVLARLAGGDKLDAMLAGLLAGYLAGTK